MKLRNSLFVILSLFVLAIGTSCSKIYEPRLEGTWELASDLTENGSSAIWIFNGGNLSIYNDPAAWLAKDTLKGSYSIQFKKAHTFVNVFMDNGAIDGFYLLEKVNKEKLILHRRFNTDMSKDGAYLRREFIKK